ncbi:MAG: signal peptidase I [Propionibacteriaceae bacterium]|jgi:signal peptidase|nr:signal peptidase I [Propionibacteriaceae bacterium]
MRILRNVVTGVVCALGALSVLLCGLVLCLQLSPYIVVSGSMEPTLSVGSMAFANEVDAASVKPGDIVTVGQPETGEALTHRVVKAEPKAGGVELTLKGDANASNDPEPYVATRVGLYRFQIPYLGYVALWIQRYPVWAGLIILALLGITFLAPAKVTVRMPDGTVLKNLTKREGERIIESYKKSIDGSGLTEIPSRALLKTDGRTEESVSGVTPADGLSPDHLISSPVTSSPGATPSPDTTTASPTAPTPSPDSIRGGSTGRDAGSRLDSLVAGGFGRPGSGAGDGVVEQTSQSTAIEPELAPDFDPGLEPDFDPDFDPGFEPTPEPDVDSDSRDLADSIFASSRR